MMKQDSQVRELRAELVRRITLSIGEAEKQITAVPRLSLFRRTRPTAPTPATYEPSVIVMAQGRKRVVLGPNTFIYDESKYLITAVDLPIVSCYVEASEAEPSLALMLKLDPGLVRELLSRDEIRVAAGAAESPAMTTGVVTAELLDACCRLVGLLGTPKDIPFLSGLIERELIYRVLRGPEGARLRAIATLGDQSHRTARAVAWIRENYARPMKVEELADLAGMGVSTLHHHFRAMTAMSPLQYQKQLRLQQARTLMLVEGRDAVSAAFAVGYESASQFNREYSRFFGQPPMRSIRTLRAAGTPVPDKMGAGIS